MHRDCLKDLSNYISPIYRISPIKCHYININSVYYLLFIITICCIIHCYHCYQFKKIMLSLLFSSLVTKYETGKDTISSPTQTASTTAVVLDDAHNQQTRSTIHNGVTASTAAEEQNGSLAVELHMLMGNRPKSGEFSVEHALRNQHDEHDIGGNDNAIGSLEEPIRSDESNVEEMTSPRSLSLSHEYLIWPRI